MHRTRRIVARRQLWALMMSTVALASAEAKGLDRPVVIAHRGASGYLPEHTLEAVAVAHAQGADYIEQDIVLTRDRVPVVLHDVQIDTVTDASSRFPDRKRPDGRFYAADFTLAEIKTLNVHERTDHSTGLPAFKGRFPVGKGTFRVPTFEEEIDLIEGLNRSLGREVGIYPELKAPAWHRREGFEIASVVVEVLKRRGYAEAGSKCFVQCFELAELVKVRTLGYGGKMVYLTSARPEPGGPDANLDEGLDRIARVADGVGPPLPRVVGELGADWVGRAHARNLVVHPYTVRVDGIAADDPSKRLEPFRALVDAKVDGYFTDFPDLGVLARAAARTPR